MRVPAFLVAASLVLTASGLSEPAAAQNRPALSLIGVRLGMDEAELVRALPADLRPTVHRSEMVLSGVPFVSVEAGMTDCGWGRLPEIGRPCVGFRAFLLKHEADGVFRVANVSLDQFFETPVPYDVLRQRLLGAFGNPTAEVLKIRMPVQPASPGTTADASVWPDGQVIQFPTYPTLPAWFWVPDLSRITSTDRVKLFDKGPNPGDIGARQPTLRAFVNLHSGHGYGLRAILSDTERMAKRDAEMQRVFREEQERRAREAGQGIRLQ